MAPPAASAMQRARSDDSAVETGASYRPWRCWQLARVPLVLASAAMMLHTLQAGGTLETLPRSKMSEPVSRRLQEAVAIDALIGLHNKSKAPVSPTISPEDLETAEKQLLEAVRGESTKVGEAIRHRHAAEIFLNDRANDIDLAVCEAGSKFFQFEVLQELVKMGGSVNKQACGDRGGTTVQEAAYWGVDEGLTRIIKELGGDPSVPNKQGLPPIYVACEGGGQFGAIHHLKKNGAQMNQTIDGKPLVMYAAEQQQFHITKCLLDNGAEWPWDDRSPKLRIRGKDYVMGISAVPKHGIEAALCTAARNNSQSQVLSYLVLGADIEYPWCWTPNLPWYTTPLGHAAVHRHKDMVRLLLDLKANRHDRSKCCVAKQPDCLPRSCFGCFSACEAFASRNDVLIPVQTEGDEELGKLLGCSDDVRASALLRKQLSFI